MRLFVAVVPSDDAVEHLDAFLEPRREAAEFRWSPAHQLHVTLAFAADAEEWRVEEWTERLAESVAEVAPRELVLAGAVAFPDPFATRVLAVGLDGAQPGEDEAAGGLPRLATKARGAATRSGIAVDGQRYRPHLTVARLRRPAGTSDWVKLLGHYRGPAWRVDAVRLVASHLGEGARGGPRHEVIAELPLGGER